MSVIKYLKDIEGTGIFPITHERAVRDSNGVNLETKINRKIDSNDFDNIVELTKAQYDALAIKDDRTVYIVSDASGEESEYVSIADVETVPSSAPGGENVTTITLTNGETIEIVTINGLTGPQGNTGSSIDYPYELVNNCTTDDATKGLSAAQGVALAGEISQLDQEIGEKEQTESVHVDLNVGAWTNGEAWKATGTQSQIGTSTSSTANSRTQQIDISGLVGKTLKYLRMTVTGASPSTGTVIWTTTEKVGIPAVGEAAESGTQEESIVIPEGATYIAFTCRTTDLENFYAYTEEPVYEYTSGIGKDVQDIKSDFNTQVKRMYVRRSDGSEDVIGGGYPCNQIRIFTRFNNAYDVMWRFGNKTNNINRNFDFVQVGRLNRGTPSVNIDTTQMTNIAGQHDTDYLGPFVVGAVNNIDGDFPTNTTYFTGAYHGYQSKTTGAYTPTMRELSKTVLVDGKAVAADGGTAWGEKVDIFVVNRIQGCNTEKEDGTGREIIEERIHIEMEAGKKPVVNGEILALEDVIIYKHYPLSMFLDFANVRYISSTSKRGLYAKNTDQSPSDKAVTEIRNIGDGFSLGISMDKTWGLGAGNEKEGGIALQVGSVTKAYFSPISDLTLAAGDMLVWRGEFNLY